ncbi:Hpt domain-containing protein [Paraflavitalea speifideaquila]|uniref:Hpt domain-containing protein n=1 Tax=Paraflavitalea speifideaquila TaxID=3076558 RepID=UPI0028F0867C|nr:Hpt domain-containing protein [Paraflavitalea speifideiaquila]
MLRLFLDTLPGSLLDMQQETAAQNWEAVGKLAHKLKSTIDSMGISSLKDTIRQIEQNGKKAVNRDQLPGQVNQVEAILKACAAQVKKDFAL